MYLSTNPAYTADSDVRRFLMVNRLKVATFKDHPPVRFMFPTYMKIDSNGHTRLSPERVDVYAALEQLGSRVIDHALYLRHAGGGSVLLVQPYVSSVECLQQFVDTCHTYGLWIRTAPNPFASFWNRNSAIILLIGNDHVNARFKFFDWQCLPLFATEAEPKKLPEITERMEAVAEVLRPYGALRPYTHATQAKSHC